MMKLVCGVTCLLSITAHGMQNLGEAYEDVKFLCTQLRQKIQDTMDQPVPFVERGEHEMVFAHAVGRDCQRLDNYYESAIKEIQYMQMQATYIRSCINECDGQEGVAAQREFLLLKSEIERCQIHLSRVCREWITHEINDLKVLKDACRSLSVQTDAFHDLWEFEKQEDVPDAWDEFDRQCENDL